MKKILIVALTLFIISCNNENKIPEYVIPQEKMIDIITDIHITDGILSINSVRRKLAKQDTSNYYDHVLDSYGYTRKDFDTSVYYYSMNIDEYDKIYAEVLNKLNELETKIKQEEVDKIPESTE